MDYQDPYSSDSESDLSLKDALRNIWEGFRKKENWNEALEGLKRTRQEIPGVAESYVRGGLAQIVGQYGDMRDIAKTTAEIVPERLRNLSNVAQFLSNPYLQTTINRAPTTEQVLEATPRLTPLHEGAKDVEMMGGWTAPGGAGVALDLVKATKGVPVGLTFIGPESAAWNKTMAFEASKLESKLLKEGLPPDQVAKEVWNATGTARGLGGEWRQEISDLFSSMKGNHETFGDLHKAIIENPEKKGVSKVGDVLEHADLAEAYPHLMDMEIRKMPADVPYRGKVTMENDVPVIHLRENLKPDEAREVLAHELQHTIQREEGYGLGGYEGSYTQQEDARLAQSALSLRQEAERMDPSIPFEQRVEEASNMLNRLTSSDRFGGEVKNIAMDVNGTPTNTLENLGVLYGTDRNIEPFSPTEMYRRIGGEAEARLTQRRLNLGEQGRQENFPFEFEQTRYQNMEPLPNYKLDVKPEEAIIHGREPGVIDVGGKRVSGEAKTGVQASMEEPKPDELGFYSPVEKAVMAIGQPKGTGDQFLAQIKKTPGVKQEELAWTGLEDFLKEKKTVTKQEVEDYMKQNKVKIEEHQLGESTASPYDEYELRGGDVYHDDDWIQSSADDLAYEYKRDADMRFEERERILEDNPEKWADWQENDSIAERLEREVDDALEERAKDHAEQNYYDNPIRQYHDDLGYEVYGNDDFGYSIKDPNGRSLRAADRGIYDISDVESAIRDDALENGLLDMGDGAKYEDYTLPGNKDNYREVLLTFPDVKGADYSSGHYDQPNILTHLRLDDRMINGKKTLFIEEIQSDWHQEGRKKGYTEPVSKERKMEIRLELEKIDRAKQELHDSRSKQVDDEQAYDSINGILTNLNRQAHDLRMELSGDKGVPNAPFKSTWHELAMKRAMDMAAKGDYEQIAWTTGAQQNSRYGLSRVVDSIDWHPYESNGATKVINVVSKNQHRLELPINDKGIVTSNSSRYNGKSLDEIVGQAMAKKIMGEEKGELAGEGLEIGGQGMKGFYDKILPDYVNKQMKKHGVRVEKADIDSNSLRADLSDEELTKGLEKLGMSSRDYYQLPISERSPIYQRISKEFYPRKGEEVHVVPITKSMRENIYGKGQPMFAVAPALAVPAMGKKEEKKTDLKELLNTTY